MPEAAAAGMMVPVDRRGPIPGAGRPAGSSRRRAPRRDGAGSACTVAPSMDDESRRPATDGQGEFSGDSSQPGPDCPGALFDDNDRDNRFVKDTGADIVYATFVTKP